MSLILLNSDMSLPAADLANTTLFNVPFLLIFDTFQYIYADIKLHTNPINTATDKENLIKAIFIINIHPKNTP